MLFFVFFCAFLPNESLKREKRGYLTLNQSGSRVVSSVCHFLGELSSVHPGFTHYHSRRSRSRGPRAARGNKSHAGPASVLFCLVACRIFAFGWFLARLHRGTSSEAIRYLLVGERKTQDGTAWGDKVEETVTGAGKQHEWWSGVQSMLLSS